MGKGADRVEAVAVFQRQSEPPPYPFVRDGGAALIPCGGGVAATVANDPALMPRCGGHVHAAEIADLACEEERLAPAGAAEALGGLRRVGAGEAAWGVDGVDDVSQDAGDPGLSLFDLILYRQSHVSGTFVRSSLAPSPVRPRGGDGLCGFSA